MLISFAGFVMRRVPFAAAVLSFTTILALSTGIGAADPNASEFRLDNGLQVVVIPDHRLPVVTHSIWYKAGSADDPAHISGLAHFLEHMMFKGTGRYPSGAFNQFVDRIGGVQNAVTNFDVTYYYQRLPKTHLPQIMEMEADRMKNIIINDEEVVTERNVVLQERKSRIDDSPFMNLYNKMREELYSGHPYARHPIGSAEEISSFRKDDALQFYKQRYMPNNAVVVISGDVTVEETRQLAEKTYGRIAKADGLPERPAFRPFAPVKTRRVAVAHERVARPGLARLYRVPSYGAQAGEGEALAVLSAILGSETGRLYRTLLAEQGLASSVNASYSWYLASGEFYIGLDAADRVPIEQLEKGLDAIIAELRERGITQDELDLERSSFIAGRVYSNDNQAALVQLYGSWMALDKTIEDVESWISKLEKISVDDVNRVIRKYLVDELVVTGELIPAQVAQKP